MNKSKTLGISMIVLNESKIILNCLESIVDYIDYWVINDTGSTDGTPDIIQRFFDERNKPGKLIYSKWVNFSHNRNIALEEARKHTDYVLLLDADFVVHVNDVDFKNKLFASGYLIRYLGGLDYKQILLINSKPEWKYHKVTHEYIDTYPQLPVEITELLNIDHKGNGSNRHDKFDRDISLILPELEINPDDIRYWFYLAQSYKDGKYYDDAIRCYEKRTTYPNWDEEVFYSYYQIGICKKRRGDDFYSYFGDFIKAWNVRPHRIEPLYQIMDSCVNYFDSNNNTESNDKNSTERVLLGYQIGMMANNYKYPIYDLLFIEKPLYDWMYLDLLSICAFRSKKYKESYDIIDRIIRENKYHESQKERFEINHTNLKRIKENTPITSNISNLFSFRRIVPENKTNRVAVFIINYNMYDKVNSLVQQITSQSNNTPCDIIVIDNGSKIQPPSSYTTIFLNTKINTIDALLNGLQYADSLELKEGFKYFSYVFCNTYVELLDHEITTDTVNIDSINTLNSILIDNDDIVGVHPALTIDSKTKMKHLIYNSKNSRKIRQTNIFDNIFSMYRSDWFNKHRFDSKLINSFANNLELSYLAKMDNFKLVVHDGVLVREIDNIRSLLGREDEDIVDQQLIKQQITNRFREKYGDNYRYILSGNYVKEYITDFILDDNILDIFYRSLLKFENIEHGHRLLIEYIYVNHHKYYNIKQPILFEIGMTNDIYPHVNSTSKLWLLSQIYNYEMISIDNNPDCVSNNIKRFVEPIREQNLGKINHMSNYNKYFKSVVDNLTLDMNNGSKLKLITAFAQNYLTYYKDNINFLYIDVNYNFENLNNTNDDQNLAIIKTVIPKMTKDSIIVINDRSKISNEVLILLNENNFDLVRNNYIALLFVKK